MLTENWNQYVKNINLDVTEEALQYADCEYVIQNRE